LPRRTVDARGSKFPTVCKIDDGLIRSIDPPAVDLCIQNRSKAHVSSRLWNRSAPEWAPARAASRAEA
jgi:hypothetical protein